MDKVTKRRLCQLTSVLLYSVFWISWPLKMERISCSRMSVQNYHSMLR